MCDCCKFQGLVAHTVTEFKTKVDGVVPLSLCTDCMVKTMRVLCFERPVHVFHAVDMVKLFADVKKK